MTLGQGVLLVAFVQLFTICCDAASSTDTTLSACDYAAENLYVVNESAAPGELFPTGYVECATATGSDAGVCGVCSCREKKVASVAGVTVAWVVCVGSGDATTCVNSGQEYCSASSSAAGASCSQDGLSSCGDISTNVGDSDSGSQGSSDIDITNGSDIHAGANDTSSSSVAATTASASGSGPSSTDASAGIDIGSSDFSSSADSTVEFDPVVTLSPGSSSGAVEEDNVISDVVGTVEPSQTSAATSPEQNIIRPSGNDGSTHELDTNNGSSSDSTWSGERLTVVLTVMCGIAAVAAIAVFVAVRKDQARKRKAVGTPLDDFTDDDCSLATPMTHRLDGRYRHGRRENRSYGGGSNGTVGSSDNTPLASIVVIGPDDDFQACGSAHQYRSYAGKLAGSGGPRTNHAVATSSRGPDAGRQQFNVSHSPSMSDLPESTPDPIFDTSNTQVSFSSSMSSEYQSAPADRLYASEDSLTGSFRMVSATYSESDRSSDASTQPRHRQTSTSTSAQDAVVNNTIVSFASSLSSLHSSQYDVRDTEASEHMHDSELYTNSSRVAISFDVGSYPASAKP